MIYCFIDLEGTLANTDHRQTLLQAKEYDAYEQAAPDDEPNEDVADLIDLLHMNNRQVIILTTRKEKYRAQTEAWLMKHKIAAQALVMRQEDEWAPEAQMKAARIKLFAETDGEEEELGFILDDNLQVCELLKMEGYRVWHRL